MSPPIHECRTPAHAQWQTEPRVAWAHEPGWPAAASTRDAFTGAGAGVAGAAGAAGFAVSAGLTGAAGAGSVADRSRRYDVTHTRRSAVCSASAPLYGHVLIGCAMSALNRPRRTATATMRLSMSSVNVGEPAA